MMNRRGFIGGLVAAVAGGEAIIKLASPEEQVLVKVGNAATMLAPQNLDPSNVDANKGMFYLAVIAPNKVRHEFVGYAHHLSVEQVVDLDKPVKKFVGNILSYGPNIESAEVQLQWYKDGIIV